MIIDKYLRKIFVKSFFAICTYFGVMLFLVDYTQFGLQNYGHSFFGLLVCLIRVIHMMRHIIYFLYAGSFIIMFSEMAKFSETTIIMSTHGYSVIKIFRSILPTILIVWLSLILLINPITSFLMKTVVDNKKFSAGYKNQVTKIQYSNVLLKSPNIYGTEDFLSIEYHPNYVASKESDKLWFNKTRILQTDANDNIIQTINAESAIFDTGKLLLNDVIITEVKMKNLPTKKSFLEIDVAINRSEIISKIYTNKDFAREIEQNYSIYSLIYLLIKGQNATNLLEDENLVKATIYAMLRIPLIVASIYFLSIGNLIKPSRGRGKIKNIMKAASVVFIIYVGLSGADNITYKTMSNATIIAFIPCLLLAQISILRNVNV